MVVRDILTHALFKSGVVGIGMTASAREEQDALMTLNMILRGIAGLSASSNMAVATAQLSGVSDYTVGTSTHSPDIVLPILPNQITGVTILRGNDRYLLGELDPVSYFNRRNTVIGNDLPVGYYWERSSPLGVLKFYEGKPTETCELQYSPYLIDVDANTSADFWVVELTPYLTEKVAAEIAVANGFEASSLIAEANRYWRIYSQSTTKRKRMGGDLSAPSGSETVFNPYTNTYVSRGW